MDTVKASLREDEFVEQFWVGQRVFTAILGGFGALRQSTPVRQQILRLANAGEDARLELKGGKLLVHDGQIQPLAKDQLSEPNMKHKLAIWASKKLPEGHPLLAG